MRFFAHWHTGTLFSSGLQILCRIIDILLHLCSLLFLLDIELYSMNIFRRVNSFSEESFCELSSFPSTVRLQVSKSTKVQMYQISSCPCFFYSLFFTSIKRYRGGHRVYDSNLVKLHTVLFYDYWILCCY